MSFLTTLTFILQLIISTTVQTKGTTALSQGQISADENELHNISWSKEDSAALSFQDPSETSTSDDGLNNTPTVVDISAPLPGGVDRITRDLQKETWLPEKHDFRSYLKDLEAILHIEKSAPVMIVVEHRNNPGQDKANTENNRPGAQYRHSSVPGATPDTLIVADNEEQAQRLRNLLGKSLTELYVSSRTFEMGMKGIYSVLKAVDKDIEELLQRDQAHHINEKKVVDQLEGFSNTQKVTNTLVQRWIQELHRHESEQSEYNEVLFHHIRKNSEAITALFNFIREFRFHMANEQELLAQRHAFTDASMMIMEKKIDSLTHGLERMEQQRSEDRADWTAKITELESSIRQSKQDIWSLGNREDDHRSRLQITNANIHTVITMVNNLSRSTEEHLKNVITTSHQQEEEIKALRQEILFLLKT